MFKIYTSAEVPVYPILLSFFLLCGECKYITHFYVIAFYTHIAQTQIINARCKPARIRHTTHCESHDRQQLMKFGSYHVLLIHFVQGIPFRCCWGGRDLFYPQGQHLSLSAGETEMKAKELHEEYRQII